jgi:hypothetical protein
MHWAAGIAFLILAATYSFGFRFPWMNELAIGIIVVAITVGLGAFFAMSYKRCDICEEKLGGQLPKQPVVGIDELFINKWVRAVVSIALDGKYKCTTCGHWNE